MADTQKVTTSDFLDKVGSLAAGMFVLYLMVSFNFIPEIFGCHLQVLLTNSFWMKHLIGLLTVFFFINVTTTSVPWDLGIKFGFSLVLYVLFVFSNKSEYASQIGFVVIIFIMYIIQLVRDQLKKNAENVVEPEELEKLLKQIKVLGYVQGGLFGSGMVMILIGHVIYIGKKKMEFGKKFDYFDMLKGSTNCKGTDKRFYTVGEALSSTFKDKRDVQLDEFNRMRNIKEYFEVPTDADVDLKVPSGLRWFQPSPQDVVVAGQNVNLPLSPKGASVLSSEQGTPLLTSYNREGLSSLNPLFFGSDLNPGGATEV